MKNIANISGKVFGSLILFTGLLIAPVSCDREDGQEFNSQSKLTIAETLTALNQQVQRAPAPGGTPIAGIAVNAGFNELVAALAYVDSELNAGLINLFSTRSGQYTVFAPTDEAFNDLYTALGINAITDLPADLVLSVLQYHVAEGRRASNSVVPKNAPRNINTLLGVSFSVNNQGVIQAVGNTAGIVAADISASNGIIHVIDAVILPIVVGEGRPAQAPGTETIATIAVNANFTELVGALAYVDAELNTGLVNLFSTNSGQFTVFAPTNQAFEDLYSALNINGIEDLPADLVLSVLQYHVVEGRRASNSVLPRVGQRTITTLLGATFSVNTQGVITAIGNSAAITTADISASNGIIHIIDTVILPIN
jgi:uncharacterized surface protein with fasciclin (FAS1) repeats